MEPNQRYDLVGGITAVVLYPTSASLPEQATTQLDSSSDGVAFSVDVGQSSYVEELLPEIGVAGGMNYRVKHSLTLQCSHDDTPFGEYTFAKMLNDGVVADVTLSTGATIRVGWSERYALSYPLRLVSTTFDSGVKPLDYPLKSWLFESIDKSVLI